MNTIQNIAHKMRLLVPAFFCLFCFSSCSLAFQILDDILTYETSSEDSYDDSSVPSGGCPTELAASAFEYARKYAAPGVSLFYNDYETAQEWKRDFIIENILKPLLNHRRD